VFLLALVVGFFECSGGGFIGADFRDGNGVVGVP